MNFSVKDVVALSAAIEERFLKLCNMHMRIKGVELVPPKSIQRAMMLWRTMCVRHSQGDFRHTDDELKGTHDFADWTLQVLSELNGKPVVKIDWEAHVRN